MEMAEILTQVTSFLTSALEWVSSCIGTITSNPVLLLLVVCMPVAGFGVGLLKRLIRLN